MNFPPFSLAIGKIKRHQPISAESPRVLCQTVMTAEARSITSTWAAATREARLPPSTASERMVRVRPLARSTSASTGSALSACYGSQSWDFRSLETVARMEQREAACQAARRQHPGRRLHAWGKAPHGKTETATNPRQNLLACPAHVPAAEAGRLGSTHTPQNGKKNQGSQEAGSWSHACCAATRVRGTFSRTSSDVNSVGSTAQVAAQAASAVMAGRLRASFALTVAEAPGTSCVATANRFSVP